MAVQIRSGFDVIDFLKSQHQDIKAALLAVANASEEDRPKAFLALRRRIAVHETAEQEIVHPAARRVITNGEEIVASRLREEKRAKEELVELERLDPRSDAFAARFDVLANAIRSHAAAEEREEFSALASAFAPNKLEQMRKAAEFAESVAPTRPHPGVESRIANLLAGPFIAMMDRARDAIRAKH